MPAAPAPAPAHISPKPLLFDILPFRMSPQGVLAPTAEDLEKKGRWTQLAVYFEKDPSLNMLRLSVRRYTTISVVDD